MRPLRMVIEGFTSFRDEVELDFAALDLFAVTGPTGAGKSSLIDALVFALYGRVPRVGKEYKQLISHGAERLSVLLEFEMGAERYRVARTARLKANPQSRLERRLADGDWEPLADRVQEIEAHVERLVGLDYDGFIRSVVLPQGQFDTFLKGEPEERRKILVALLNLRAYETMQQIARERAASARREAEFIAGQLATDYAGATPAALERKQAERAAAVARRDRLERAQEELAVGLKAAQAARAARVALEQAEHDLAGERQRCEAARGQLEAAAATRRRLEQAQARIEQARSDVPFDDARVAVLAAARAHAVQLAALVPKTERLLADASGREAALARRRHELESVRAELPELERASGHARQALVAARDERDATHRQHAAHALRRQLKPGQPCPVCEQDVARVPKGAAPALAAGDERVKAAESAAERAAKGLEQARILAEGTRRDVEALTREVAQLDARKLETAASFEMLTRALSDAGFAADAVRDPAGLAARIAGECEALEKARAERQQLDVERRRVEAESAALERTCAAATASVDAAESRIGELEARLVPARRALEREQERLAAVMRNRGSRPDATTSGDVCDALEAEAAAARREAAEADASIGRLETEVLQLEAALSRSAELQVRKQGLESRATLAGTLALHLQANQFLAYVQEEALRGLAEQGSQRLKTLSQGRYSLACEGQEFQVVDHWNGDSQRSVKTLSGGETFLASLALALALAESLAALSAEGRASDALESLFLDEGFGTLDPETLDLVVQAIEALQGGQRMVGVITHIAELAERLPARVEVRRDGDRSVVCVA